MDEAGHDIGGVIVDNAPKDARSGYLVGYIATRCDSVDLKDLKIRCPEIMGTFREKIQILERWLSSIGASGIFHWNVRTFSPGRLGLHLDGDSGQAAIALAWGMLWECRDNWLVPLLKTVVVTGAITEETFPEKWEAQIKSVGCIGIKLEVFARDSARSNFRLIAMPESCAVAGCWQCRIVVAENLNELRKRLKAVFARAEFYKQSTLLRLFHCVSGRWYFALAWFQLALILWLFAPKIAVLAVLAAVLLMTVGLRLTIWYDEREWLTEERERSKNSCKGNFDAFPEGSARPPSVVIAMLEHMQNLDQSRLSALFRKSMVARLKATGWLRGWLYLADFTALAFWIGAVAYLGLDPGTYQLAETIPWGGKTVVPKVCWYTTGGSNCALPGKGLASGIGKNGFLELSIPHRHGVWRRIHVSCARCSLSPAMDRDRHSALMEVGEGITKLRVDYHDLALPPNEFSFQFDITLFSYQGDPLGDAVSIPVRWNPEIDIPPVTGIR